MNSPKDPGEVILGKILEDEIIPPGQPWARVLRRGQALRIIDLEGQQGVDFLCYNASNPEERYHAANTLKAARTIFLSKGHTLYSDAGRPLVTIIEDTCGRHDTIAGCCSAESNFMLYGVKAIPGCRENFLRALAAFGLGRKDIVANVNFFSNVPVAPDGKLADTVFLEGLSKAGDFVDLRAEMDALAVISNCPQINNPCTGLKPTPIRVLVWEPEQGT